MDARAKQVQQRVGHFLVSEVFADTENKKYTRKQELQIILAIRKEVAISEKATEVQDPHQWRKVKDGGVLSRVQGAKKG